MPHLNLGFLLHEHLQDTVIVGVIAEWTVRAARWYRRRHAGTRAKAVARPPEPPPPHPAFDDVTYARAMQREAQRRGMRL